MRQLVISVHGIRTYGNWQERLEGLLGANSTDRQLTVINYKYGYFPTIAFILPFLRWLIVRRFGRFLLDMVQGEQWDRIDLVGHSFGTHIIAWALYGLDERIRPSVNTVIFAGSVLKNNFPWQVLLGRSVKRLVNDCGVRDEVLILNQLVVLFTGMAGRLGFNGGTGRTFRNRFFYYGHSGYFLTDGRPDDSFMQRYWLPLLLTDSDPELVDARRASALGGIYMTLLNNAEPLKLAVYMAPVIASALWINGLYLNTRRERDQALLTQSHFLADLARQRVEAGDSETAMLLAMEALPDQTSENSIQRERPYANQAEISLYQGLHTDREIALLHGHAKGVYRAVYSPDGTSVLTVSEDSTARLWDASTWQMVAVLSGHTSPIAALAFNPDGTRIATASRDNTVRLWDAKTGQQIQILADHTKPVVWVTFSTDGSRLLTASFDNTVRVWDARTGQQIAILTHQWPVLAVISADQRIVTLDRDATLRLWDMDSFQQLAVINIPRQGDFAMKAMEDIAATIFSTHGNGKLRTSVDGRRVMALWARTAVVVNVADGKPIFTLDLPVGDQQILDADLSPDGHRVVTGALTGTARLWDVEAGNQIASLALGLNVTHIKFTPEASRILATSGDQIQILDATTLKRNALIGGHAAGVQYAALSPDGGKIVSASADGTARVWDAVQPLAIVRITPDAGPSVQSISFSADGARLLSTANTGLGVVWDARTGKKLIELKESDVGQDSAAFSPDGAVIVASSYGNLSGIWDAYSGEKIGAVASNNAWWIAPFGIPLPNLSKNLLLTTTPRDVRLWNVATNALTKHFGSGVVEFPDSFITPDGANALTQDGALFIEKFVRMWDTKSGQNVATLEGSNLQVLTWSFDGSRVVTIPGEGDSPRISITIWDGRTGSALVTLKADAGEITQASISRDGARVVTVSDDRTVRVWNATNGIQLAQFAATYDGLIRISPDGSRLALSSKEKTGDVAIVETTTGVGLEQLSIADPSSRNSQSDALIEEMGFSEDGSRMFAVFTSNLSTRTKGFAYWETASWKPLLILRTQPRIRWQKGAGLTSTAQSQNGKCLGGIAPDNSARILDVATMLEINRLQARNDQSITRALFTRFESGGFPRGYM
jgi:WD40 repeat protein